MTQIGWLSEEELVFHRMLTFHRERIAEVSANTQMNSHVGKGILIVHLIPKQSIVARTQVATKQLKEYGSRVRPLGEQGGSSRFNVDGLMNYSGRDELRAYSQIFRDGRIEAVMLDAAYSRRNETNAFVLRDRVCEKGVIELVRSYFAFITALQIEPPIWMFSALLDCKGVRIVTDRDFGDVSDHSIDRSPAFMPAIEIISLETKVDSLLQPWCDSLWQSSGLERSYSFDEHGNWHERQ